MDDEQAIDALENISDRISEAGTSLAEKQKEEAKGYLLEALHMLKDVCTFFDITGEDEVND